MVCCWINVLRGKLAVYAVEMYCKLGVGESFRLLRKIDDGNALMCESGSSSEEPFRVVAAIYYPRETKIFSLEIFFKSYWLKAARTAAIGLFLAS
jgi:hypothetical protein